MPDTRLEIKDAFARRIDAAPMSPDLAVRVSEHVARRPHRPPLRFATAVAVLLATATIGTLLYLVTASHRQPAPVVTPLPVVTPSSAPSETPAPTPSPTATTTASAGPRITTFPLPPSYVGPSDVTWGPDGVLWFTVSSPPAGLIERLDGAGGLRRFDVNVTPEGIVAGPDGALWVAAWDAGQKGVILRVTTDGRIARYPLQSDSSQATGITLGPDGALWFTEKTGNRIGRITTSGAVTEYALPTSSTAGQCGQRCPLHIATGPDGALWFTESQFAAGGGNKIGRITVQGTITEYQLPNPNALPTGIARGADDNLWFTEDRGGRVGRITPDGRITEFALPGAAAGGTTTGIAAGPDGAVWFTGVPARADLSTPIDRLYRVTPDGTITELRLPGPAVAVASGGGALWVAGQNQIWRVDLQ